MICGLLFVWCGGAHLLDFSLCNYNELWNQYWPDAWSRHNKFGWMNLFTFLSQKQDTLVSLSLCFKSKPNLRLCTDLSVIIWHKCNSNIVKGLKIMTICLTEKIPRLCKLNCYENVWKCFTNTSKRWKRHSCSFFRCMKFIHNTNGPQNMHTLG